MIAYNIVDTENGLSIVLMYNFKPFTITDENHRDIKGVIAALRSNDEKALGRLLTPKNFTAYVEESKELAFDGKNVTYGGVILNNAVANKIRKFAASDVPYEYLFKFLDLLLKNPDEHSREQLYAFMERNDLPINADGHIVAYKGLRADYTSVHAGKGTVVRADGTSEYNDNWNIPNEVGNTVTVPRDYVTNDPNTACSYGLHVGSLEYVQGFAQGKIVLCAVSPEDVVSVPKDSAFMKIRVCRYTVVGEFTKEITEQVYEESEDVVEQNNLDVIRDVLTRRIEVLTYDRSQAYTSFNAMINVIASITGLSVKELTSTLGSLDRGLYAVRKSDILKFLA